MERYCHPQVFDSNAGPWPIEFSEQEKEEQRAAGTKLQDSFKDAIAQDLHVFEIPPGVYRLDEGFVMDGYNGMHFKADNAELIMEGPGRHSHFMYGKFS